MVGAGDLGERLVVRTSLPLPVAVTSLVRASTTATATTAAPHGYASNDFVTIAGATPAGYNGKVKITVTGASTFTYQVLGSLATPATGTITVVYVSDAQGGRVVVWRTLDTIAAQLIPIRATERLQRMAIQSDVAYRFRVRLRKDLVPTMRAWWTPRWPENAPVHTLEITGLFPDPEDVLTFLLLECNESAASAA